MFSEARPGEPMGERLTNRSEQLAAFIPIAQKQLNKEPLTPEEVTQMIDVREDLVVELRRLGNGAGRLEGEDLAFYNQLVKELPEQYGILDFANQAMDRERASIERYKVVNGEDAMSDNQKARLEELRRLKAERDEEATRQEDENASNVRAA